MNPIKESTLAIGIVLALLSSVGCAANNDYVQMASNEVFSSSESFASNLYQKGQKALDKGDWKQATKHFSELVKKNSQHTDAALYWKAYSQYKDGKKSSSHRTLKKLFKEFSNSRWTEEGKALQAELLGVEQVSQFNNDEMKTIALNSLLHASPEKALPILKKTLASDSSNEVKEMALFILSQQNSPEARQLIENIAMNDSNSELQEEAIHMLAISGDKKSRKILGNLYSKVTSREVREVILHGFMISGDKARILELARTEKDVELRGTAIELLGHIGAEEELIPLYDDEKSNAVKESIINAMMIAGYHNGISHILDTEKDPELLTESIQMLGVMGKKAAGLKLKTLWDNNKNPEIRDAIIESWMMAGMSDNLLQVAKSEKEPALVKKAIEMLAVMGKSGSLKELYSNKLSTEIRKTIIESYMISGDSDALLKLLETELEPALQKDAIEMLAVMGKSESLTKFYSNNLSIDTRKTIIEGYMISGDSKALITLLDTETEPELQRKIIEMLGVMQTEGASQALINLYKKTSETELKSYIMKYLMIQGNAKSLVNIFRTENNKELKREAARNLAMMNSKEAQDLMLELLDQE